MNANWILVIEETSLAAFGGYGCCKLIKLFDCFQVLLDVQANLKEDDTSVSQPQITINQLCEDTSIKKEDVISTLQVCSYFYV